MKTTREKADELVEKIFWAVAKDKLQAVKIAILSVKHTLSVLETISLRWQTQLAINEQTELLKELESRL